MGEQLKVVYIPISVQDALKSYEYEINNDMSSETLMNLLSGDDARLVSEQSTQFAKYPRRNKGEQCFTVADVVDSTFITTADLTQRELNEALLSGSMSDLSDAMKDNIVDDVLNYVRPVALTDGVLALLQVPSADLVEHRSMPRGYTRERVILESLSHTFELENIMSLKLYKRAFT